MPSTVLYRIDHYREYLHSNTQITNTHNHDDQSHPPPNGGSGDALTLDMDKMEIAEDGRLLEQQQ